MSSKITPQCKSMADDWIQERVLTRHEGIVLAFSSISFREQKYEDLEAPPKSQWIFENAGMHMKWFTRTLMG